MDLSRIGRISPGLVLGVAMLWASSMVVAGHQETDLNKRIAALEAGQKEILKQLQELKALLQEDRPLQPDRVPVSPPQLPGTPIAIAGAATRGNPTAKLVIVEFSDFECSYCGRYARETFTQLERDYVDTNQVRYVFRHFPLERLHPNAFNAAEAGECALQQGRFWEMHTLLYASQQALTGNDLVSHARAVGLDVPKFQTCAVSGPVSAKIRQDLSDGTRAGVTGTPTMFLGTLQKDGQVHVLRKVVGAVSYPSLKSTIDTLLASVEKTK
jgi:protein-disulfide isomerase